MARNEPAFFCNNNNDDQRNTNKGIRIMSDVADVFSAAYVRKCLFFSSVTGISEKYIKNTKGDTARH